MQRTWENPPIVALRLTTRHQKALGSYQVLYLDYITTNYLILYNFPLFKMSGHILFSSVLATQHFTDRLPVGTTSICSHVIQAYHA